MTSSPDEPIKILMEAFIQQGRILEQQREILEQLAAAQLETSRAVEEARHAPAREHREAHEFERDQHVDTLEQRAVIAHYHQLRSQLGRRGAQFAVLVRRVDHGKLLSLAGAPTHTARSIEVDTLRTAISAWVRDPHDPDVLTCSQQDVVGVETGKPVRLYAGPYLVGVGYWPVDITPAPRRK